MNAPATIDHQSARESGTTTPLSFARDCLFRNKALVLGGTLVFVLVYYMLQLASLVVVFKNWPNYINSYNWPANVAEIIRSTPSWSDAWAIILDEWLLEIGFMNYDYGMGISEWALNVQPFTVLQVTALGFFAMMLLALFRQVNQLQSAMQNLGLGLQCPTRRRWLLASSGGVGAALVSMASLTLFWVVCCASPTWVVGLAMLGLVSVSTALWLDPLEIYVTVTGFLLLVLACYLLAQTGNRLSFSLQRNQ